MTSGDDREIRAKANRPARRHRGADAELSRFIRRGRNDAPASGRSADNNRLPVERRILDPLDGDEEAVEVEMSNVARRVHVRGTRKREGLFSR